MVFSFMLSVVWLLAHGARPRSGWPTVPEHPRGDEQDCRGARRLQSAHRADAAPEVDDLQAWRARRVGAGWWASSQPEGTPLKGLGPPGFAPGRTHNFGRLVSLKARQAVVLEARQRRRLGVLQ